MKNIKRNSILFSLVGIFFSNSALGCCGFGKYISRKLNKEKSNKNKEISKHAKIIKDKREIVVVAKELVWAIRKKKNSSCDKLLKKYHKLYSELQKNGCESFLKVALEDVTNKEVIKESFSAKAIDWILTKLTENGTYIAITILISLILRKIPIKN